MKRRTGFTLAELLIVIAIIAILIGITLPVLNQKLEKSRDVVTAANLRAAYAEAVEDILNGKATSDSNGVYKVEKTVTVLGLKDGGVSEADGISFPFDAGTDFSDFGNKNRGKSIVVFEWTLDASRNTGEIQFTNRPTASAK